MKKLYLTFYLDITLEDACLVFFEDSQKLHLLKSTVATNAS